MQNQGLLRQQNAVKVNKVFEQFLEQYEIKYGYVPLLIDELLDRIENMNASVKERQGELKSSLKEVQEKIDTVDEKYFVTGEMSKETYDKLVSKFVKEK